MDHATVSGTAAGRAAAGADEPYAHTPYFYSAVFGVRWEAVGTLDPQLETVDVDLAAEGADDARGGVPRRRPPCRRAAVERARR
ncbi:hypothetical protein [Microbacterium sp. 10M-3C3]|uniref:hypothetical protein n=1 Tax=Microbacterium sp. 10M-3C3 TaxID=2483401 RepID=UPI001F0C8FF4|nr:hypothetical protein [Microbacterium sp. 10M-3C3]